MHYTQQNFCTPESMHVALTSSQPLYKKRGTNSTFAPGSLQLNNRVRLENHFLNPLANHLDNRCDKIHSQKLAKHVANELLNQYVLLIYQSLLLIYYYFSSPTTT